jgi:hypothetical protein
MGKYIIINASTQIVCPVNKRRVIDQPAEDIHFNNAAGKNHQHKHGKKKEIFFLIQ